ncbi:LacI family DNA-binding transcriptional regulator [Rhodoferax sp. PAMC 29310]|uniref:LacI family DNA-binding transcriptional regulator n=1 Tax=Rhodoferax sp. PAMC 29310 TaxID=2822760 RepID=UPI001B32DC51|nr:LacI family DNA-binding transcriptional regulator [Rhodoferax sp. PAMC 29310]
MTRSTTATIEDVARRAAVSISTVSNVLNGRQARMRPETLERVQQVIAELDFRPNQSARRLKTGHIAMIGLLVPSIANPFFGALARWVEETANERGYGVLLCNTQRSAEREQAYAQSFMAQGIKGVILGSSLQAQDHLAPLISKGLAVVSFDRTAQLKPLAMDYVSLDNFRAGAMAAEHLIALGHRDIVYVSAPLRSVSRVARLEGARDACATHKVKFESHVREVTPGQTEMDIAELGRAGGVALHARGTKATGFIAMNDMLAIGLLAGLRQCKLRVPDDVSVMGIDDMFLGAYLSPALSTVRQPMQEMASAAVERVLVRLKDSNEPAHELVFTPELVVRESTAAKGPVNNSNPESKLT